MDRKQQQPLTRLRSHRTMLFAVTIFVAVMLGSSTASAGPVGQVGCTVMDTLDPNGVCVPEARSQPPTQPPYYWVCIQGISYNIWLPNGDGFYGCVSPPV